MFRVWRHLWDDRRTQIAIVFVGGGDCYQVLRREPMLSSRVYVWQEFRRLTRDEVLPSFRLTTRSGPAHSQRTRLRRREAGHGNFRAWSKITSHVVTGLARLERDVVDRDVLQWALRRLSGSSA